jgi:RNA polymerase sporulation-specific sigma factor
MTSPPFRQEGSLHQYLAPIFWGTSHMAHRLALGSCSKLSDEQLVALFQQGEAEALEILLRRYRRFARSKARSYFLAGADADDVEQEGLIGLYKAARDFQADRQVSFRTFADLCMSRQVISAVKAATRNKHRPLNQYISISSASAAHPEDRNVDEILNDHRGVDPADEVISHELIKAIRGAIRESLSGLELDVLRLYVQGKSYEEIGRQLGRQTKSIDNALQRIKRKLDVHLTDGEDALVA